MSFRYERVTTINMSCSRDDISMRPQDTCAHDYSALPNSFKCSDYSALPNSFKCSRSLSSIQRLGNILVAGQGRLPT